MIGFLPGFPYLLGLPEVLHLPRKTSPNTRVPMGSVAIADVFSGIYPIQSPGGWYIVGNTSFELLDSKGLSTLSVGDTVKFKAI